MEIPCNFFEVTINSNKLFASIQELHRKLEQQDTVIQTLDGTLKTIHNSIWDKINGRLSSINLEIEKRSRANFEELNHFKLLINDQDKKLDRKFHEFEGQAFQLNSKISAMKQSIEEDTCLKISYLQRKIQNILTAQQTQSLMRQENQKVEFLLQKLSEKHDKEIRALQEKINQNSLKIKQSVFLKQHHDEEGEEVNRMAVTFSELPEKRKSRSQTRKRLKTQRMGTVYQQSSDVKLFMSKIEQLQSKLNKENQPAATRAEPSASGHKGREKTKEILDKITKIADDYSAKLPQFEQKMLKINNKYEIIDEHIGILSRKVDKERSQVTQISQLVKQMDEKRIDDKVIEHIKTSIKLLAKQFEEEIGAKIDKDLFEKEKKKNSEKISHLFGLIDDKCEKSEVKKGLTFLEDKIKDIVIVLAEERNLIKDSAAKRIQAKCLSCDKELEPPNSDTIQNIHKSMRPSVGSNLTGRSSTSQLKKRIRVVHGSIVNEDLC